MKIFLLIFLFLISFVGADDKPRVWDKIPQYYVDQRVKNFINDIVSADFNCKFEDLKLPLPVKNGLILHKGKFTPGYEYMNEFL